MRGDHIRMSLPAFPLLDALNLPKTVDKLEDLRKLTRISHIERYLCGPIPVQYTTTDAMLAFHHQLDQYIADLNAHNRTVRKQARINDEILAQRKKSLRYKIENLKKTILAFLYIVWGIGLVCIKVLGALFFVAALLSSFWKWPTFAWPSGDNQPAPSCADCVKNSAMVFRRLNPSMNKLKTNTNRNSMLISGMAKASLTHARQMKGLTKKVELLANVVVTMNQSHITGSNSQALQGQKFDMSFTDHMKMVDNGFVTMEEVNKLIETEGNQSTSKIQALETKSILKIQALEIKLQDKGYEQQKTLLDVRGDVSNLQAGVRKYESRSDERLRIIADQQANNMANWASVVFTFCFNEQARMAALTWEYQELMFRYMTIIHRDAYGSIQTAINTGRRGAQAHVVQSLLKNPTDLAYADIVKFLEKPNLGGVWSFSTYHLELAVEVVYLVVPNEYLIEKWKATLGVWALTFLIRKVGFRRY